MPSYTQRQYHDAVIAELQLIDWQKDVGFYPDTRTQLKTPALYFSVDSWSRADSGTDQLHIDQDCSIWIVVDRSLDIDSPELCAREYAADISQLVEGRTFGLDIEPAVFQSATMDNLDPGLKDYYVWRVSYGQEIPLGRDLHDFPRTPLKQVYVSSVPDIGLDHIDDYDPMFPEKLSDE
ncbi:hypothetical protein D8682_04995 [Buttiauxella sp. 3AFRM03]|uniref:hypothetical protein n=1 Tax=Buttiauxella sp. 3AFRM03 TaxID=2479367 RepID=UPI000EF8198E|nr:hypothetical protein [Buttiauxella sp. 3AFRM03]AYN26411.1 hypothetical protein D8682_04995 [Buttiauxella sp. 3AFRM03]